MKDRYCSQCGAPLGEQSGFSTENEEWICAECGCTNHLEAIADQPLQEEHSETQRFLFIQTIKPIAKTLLKGTIIAAGALVSVQTLRLRKENRKNRGEIVRLKDLCEEKDLYFKELMSDGLRHGSRLAAKHMADRRVYLNGR